MASDIGRTIDSARRFMSVVQFFKYFIRASLWVGFSNVECQMSNVVPNLTDVKIGDLE